MSNTSVLMIDKAIGNISPDECAPKEAGMMDDASLDMSSFDFSLGDISFENSKYSGFEQSPTRQPLFDIVERYLVGDSLVGDQLRAYLSSSRSSSSSSETGSTIGDLSPLGQESIGSGSKININHLRSEFSEIFSQRSPATASISSINDESERMTPQVPRIYNDTNNNIDSLLDTILQKTDNESHDMTSPMLSSRQPVRNDNSFLGNRRKMNVSKFLLRPTKIIGNSQNDQESSLNIPSPRDNNIRKDPQGLDNQGTLGKRGYLYKADSQAEIYPLCSIQNSSSRKRYSHTKPAKLTIPIEKREYMEYQSRRHVEERDLNIDMQINEVEQQISDLGFNNEREKHTLLDEVETPETKSKQAKSDKRKAMKWIFKARKSNVINDGSVEQLQTCKVQPMDTSSTVCLEGCHLPQHQENISTTKFQKNRVGLMGRLRKSQGETQAKSEDVTVQSSTDQDDQSYPSNPLEFASDPMKLEKAVKSRLLKLDQLLAANTLSASIPVIPSPAPRRQLRRKNNSVVQKEKINSLLVELFIKEEMLDRKSQEEMKQKETNLVATPPTLHKLPSIRTNQICEEHEIVFDDCPDREALCQGDSTHTQSIYEDPIFEDQEIVFDDYITREVIQQNDNPAEAEILEERKSLWELWAPIMTPRDIEIVMTSEVESKDDNFPIVSIPKNQSLAEPEITFNSTIANIVVSQSSIKDLDTIVDAQLRSTRSRQSNKSVSFGSAAVSTSTVNTSEILPQDHSSALEDCDILSDQCALNEKLPNDIVESLTSKSIHSSSQASKVTTKIIDRLKKRQFFRETFITEKDEVVKTNKTKRVDEILKQTTVTEKSNKNFAARSIETVETIQDSNSCKSNGSLGRGTVKDMSKESRLPDCSSHVKKRSIMRMSSQDSKNAKSEMIPCSSKSQTSVSLVSASMSADGSDMGRTFDHETDSSDEGMKGGRKIGLKLIKVRSIGSSTKIETPKEMHFNSLKKRSHFGDVNIIKQNSNESRNECVSKHENINLSMKSPNTSLMPPDTLRSNNSTVKFESSCSKADNRQNLLEKMDMLKTDNQEIRVETNPKIHTLCATTSIDTNTKSSRVELCDDINLQKISSTKVHIVCENSALEVEIESKGTSHSMQNQMMELNIPSVATANTSEIEMISHSKQSLDIDQDMMLRLEAFTNTMFTGLASEKHVNTSSGQPLNPSLSRTSSKLPTTNDEVKFSFRVDNKLNRHKLFNLKKLKNLPFLKTEKVDESTPTLNNLDCDKVSNSAVGVGENKISINPPSHCSRESYNHSNGDTKSPHISVKRAIKSLFFPSTPKVRDTEPKARRITACKSSTPTVQVPIPLKNARSDPVLNQTDRHQTHLSADNLTKSVTEGKTECNSTRIQTTKSQTSDKQVTLSTNISKSTSMQEVCSKSILASTSATQQENILNSLDTNSHHELHRVASTSGTQTSDSFNACSTTSHHELHQIVENNQSVPVQDEIDTFEMTDLQFVARLETPKHSFSGEGMIPDDTHSASNELRDGDYVNELKVCRESMSSTNQGSMTKTSILKVDTLDHSKAINPRATLELNKEILKKYSDTDHNHVEKLESCSKHCDRTRFSFFCPTTGTSKRSKKEAVKNAQVKNSSTGLHVNRSSLRHNVAKLFRKRNDVSYESTAKVSNISNNVVFTSDLISECNQSKMQLVTSAMNYSESSDQNKNNAEPVALTSLNLTLSNSLPRDSAREASFECRYGLDPFETEKTKEDECLHDRRTEKVLRALTAYAASKKSKRQRGTSTKPRAVLTKVPKARDYVQSGGPQTRKKRQEKLLMDIAMSNSSLNERTEIGRIRTSKERNGISKVNSRKLLLRSYGAPMSNTDIVSNSSRSRRSSISEESCFTIEEKKLARRLATDLKMLSKIQKKRMQLGFDDTPTNGEDLDKSLVLLKAIKKNIGRRKKSNKVAYGFTYTKSGDTATQDSRCRKY